MTSKDLQFAKFINFHTHQAHKQDDLFIIHSYSFEQVSSINTQSYFSVGVHPWNAKQKINNLDDLDAFFKSEYCLFIGETGLDRCQGAKIEVQEHIFKIHITESEKRKMPLIIHCVKALADILRIRNESKAKMPWVIHDFNGNEEQIRNAIRANLFISLGPTYFKQQNSNISRCAHTIPIDRVFFETDDCPDIDIKDVYTKFAYDKGIELDKLCKQVNLNLKTILYSRDEDAH